MFQCPSCQTTQPASKSVAGRRVRCPNCDELVEVPGQSVSDEGEVAVAPVERQEPEPEPAETNDDGKGTVTLTPQPEAASGDTVLLEAIEVEEFAEPEKPAPPADEKPKPKRPRKEEEADASFKTKRPLEETEMDMTPMVDVTFLLLIFFMVTAAFALQKSIEVPKPSDEEPSPLVQQDPQENPDNVTVRVDEYNTYHVSTVDWEEEAPSVQDLHIRLRRARDGDSSGTKPTSLLVEAHGDALHGRVVAALDAGTATGFEEVQLSTVEEEE